MKLDVHRQVHLNLEGKRVVTIEGIDVCMAAWRHISSVPDSTFHRFQKYATRGDTTQPHGNLGLQKPRKHTEQATATLRCVLEKSADHMPHRSRVLPSGEKVVSMILPATFKWKETIPEVNSANAVFGLKGVFASNISWIRKRDFKEYDAKKLGDNFARCSTCDSLYTL